VAQDTPAHRLERLEAFAEAGGMAADALAGAVVDGDEDRARPSARVMVSVVSVPHMTSTALVVMCHRACAAPDGRGG
jgi:hypothetical protein